MIRFRSGQKFTRKKKSQSVIHFCERSKDTLNQLNLESQHISDLSFKTATLTSILFFFITAWGMRPSLTYSNPCSQSHAVFIYCIWWLNSDIWLSIHMFCCLQVTVNGVDYQPQTASPNKKHAKAMAATVALQALGEVILKTIIQAVGEFHSQNIILFYFILPVLSLFGYSPCSKFQERAV